MFYLHTKSKPNSLTLLNSLSPIMDYNLDTITTIATLCHVLMMLISSY